MDRLLNLDTATRMKRAARPTLLSLAALLLSFTTIVPFSFGQDSSQTDKSWDLGLALGYGQRSNPLIHSDDIDIYWSLDFAWYGQRFFFDNGDLGFSLIDNEHYTMNIVTRLNTERVFFSEQDNRFLDFVGGNSLNNANGVPSDGNTPSVEVTIPDRDYAVEVGVELLSDGHWGYLQAQLTNDISGVHNGSELWLSYGYDIVIGRWHIRPSMSVSWKSSELNNYYYGIRADESSQQLPSYRAHSGVNWNTKLSAAYVMSANWRLVLIADYERLNNEASKSPMLSDNKTMTYFTGVYYQF